MRDTTRQMIREMFEDPVERVMLAVTLGIAPAVPLQDTHSAWIAAWALSSVASLAAMTLAVRIAVTPVTLETDDAA